ncbi:hypothetical protein ONZ27_005646 [Salmonella enterica subsp. enterica serovar Chandans]|nr:hypothetical protein [Salmonella enterica subsp. enterica serovar Chandans]
MDAKNIETILADLCNDLKEGNFKSMQVAINENIAALLYAKSYYTWEIITNYINEATGKSHKISTYVTMARRAKLSDKKIDSVAPSKKTPASNTLSQSNDIPIKEKTPKEKLTINDFPYTEITDDLISEYKKSLPMIGIVSLKQLIKHGIEISEVLSWEMIMTDMVATTKTVNDKCFEKRQNWFNKNRWNDETSHTE